jgi:predicted small integral membrane protein
MIYLPKAVLLAGMGCWLAISLFNNLSAFRSGMRSIADVMTMRHVDEDPTIDTPLIRHRVLSSAWHRMVFVIILTTEAVAAALLACSALLQIAGAFGLRTEYCLPITFLAIAAFLALASLMLSGGAWFAYHLKQGVVQLTHLVMLGIGGIAAVLAGLPSG